MCEHHHSQEFEIGVVEGAELVGDGRQRHIVEIHALLRRGVEGAPAGRALHGVEQVQLRLAPQDLLRLDDRLGREHQVLSALQVTGLFVAELEFQSVAESGGFYGRCRIGGCCLSGLVQQSDGPSN